MRDTQGNLAYVEQLGPGCGRKRLRRGNRRDCTADQVGRSRLWGRVDHVAGRGQERQRRDDDPRQ